MAELRKARISVSHSVEVSGHCMDIMTGEVFPASQPLAPCDLAWEQMNRKSLRGDHIYRIISFCPCWARSYGICAAEVNAFDQGLGKYL